MKLRIVGAVCLSALAIAWLTGCSAITEKASEKAAESAAENLLEKTTGAKDVDINENGGSIKVKTDQGETEISGSSGKEVKMPDDFPSDIPIYDPAKLTNALKTTSDGKTGFNIVFESSDKPGDVVKFYKEELPKNGYTISSTFESGAGSAILSIKKGENEIGNVNVTVSEGKTVIMIGITK
ncbi:MAG: hypothetical protein HY779_05900 [Rubrobacteridae bacterium]|nr:hypothetical protein [Rubrobacteridae bacterium]